MADLDTFSLEKSPEPPADERGRSIGLWVTLAILVAAAAALVWYLVVRQPATSPPPVVASAEREIDFEAPPRLLPESHDLPSLDGSDPFVRELVRRLSAHPSLAAWLATPRLIRTFTVTVDNVANGVSPVKHVPFLIPAEPFHATGTTRVRLDPRSYHRFDAVAEIVDSVDPVGAAQAYLMLKPLVTEAYRELGYPDGDFEESLARAFRRILETPVVEGDIPLVAHSVAYRFADPRLESLSSVQKQLLGVGPRNLRLIQNKIREIARALALPDDQWLP